MGKNIVIIAGSCIPVPSATGSIALRYAKHLLNKLDCEISIVCAQEQKHKYHGSVVDGITYYAIPNFRLNRFQIHHEKIKTSRGLKLLYHKLFHFLYRAIGKITSIFLTLNNCHWFTKKAYRVLTKINRVRSIDCIISFNSPIESHLAGLKFKNNYGCIFIPFMTDLIPAASNATDIFISLKKLEMIELNILNHCDKCFVTEEIFFDMEKRLDKSLLESKVYSAKYCLNDEILSLASQEKQYGDNKKTTFFYYGSFYKGIRNPTYLIDLFGKINNSSLVIYASGNCDTIIKNSPLFGRNMFLFEPISFQEVVKKALEADVLINVDNVNTSSKPSKMFELISYGKPIVSLGDSNSYFDYHGQVCCVFTRDDVDKNASKIANFLSNFVKKYSKEELINYYPDRLENINIENLISIINS